MDKATINRLAYSISTNDWDEISELIIDNYRIIQFQGTAFDSDYQCYRIDVLNKNSKGFHPKAVAKNTNRLELVIIDLLLQRGFNVPRVIQTLTNGSENVMIFEDYINGRELYERGTVFNWKITAQELGRLHSSFWNDTEILRKKDV